MPRPAPRLIRATMMLAAIFVAGGAARGESPWYEGFEGPEPSWRPAGGDVQYQVTHHRRVSDEARTGETCEHLAVYGTNGTELYFRHDIGRPRVIDELLPTVQVKSDRAGIQFLAKVVLPRSRDPGTGKAVTTLIRGSSYANSGAWQQLRIQNVPEQLARQTRVLRAELGPDVDPREAYLECVLLNVYGGPGLTNVWIDDLDVGGYVGPAPGTDGLPGAEAATGARANPAGVGTPAGTTGWRSGADPPRRKDSPRIDWGGTVLLVDGRPFFPRIIEYQGEPLAVLQRLGFNAVWLREPPSPEMLDEAGRLGLWLVCPPPRPFEPVSRGGPDLPLGLIGSHYGRVLAWDLGRDLTAGQLDAFKQWAEQVRAADREVARPLVCQPANDLRNYSRYADVLMIGRSPLGTSLELSDYGTWLRQRPRLAQPGKPIWTTVQTQFAPGVLRQWAGLGLGGDVPSSASSEQMRLLTYTAVTAGVRGVLFQSRTPLDAPDDDTQRRAMTLELLNLELTLIERWLAVGDVVANADGSVPEVKGSVLRSDHARLVVPVWSGPGAQVVPGQSAGRGVSLVVRGVPESSNAYLMLPGALEPIRPQRVAGGTRVTLDEFGVTSLVLLTGEQLVVSRLLQQTHAIGRRAAQLQRDLAVGKLQMVDRIERRLSSDSPGPSQSRAWLNTAGKEIDQSDAALAAGDYPNAYRHAQRSMRALRLAERGHWESVVGAVRSAVSNPAAVSFPTLPACWALQERIASAPRGPNVLPAGDFEDLDATLSTGWLHVRPESSVTAEAELATGAAHSGRFGLRLAAEPVDPASVDVTQAGGMSSEDTTVPGSAAGARRARGGGYDVLVESPPALMTSPAVPVEAGELLSIHGWVQVPAPITGSVDGLLIIDSLAGESLAERVPTTSGWQEFTLYRIAPERGAVTVTFALSGLGEAWIDDVTIRAIPAARPVGNALRGVP